MVRETTLDQEPKPARGVFAKLGQSIAQAAQEYRARTPITQQLKETTDPPSSSLAPERVAELRGLSVRKWAKNFAVFDLEIAPKMVPILDACRTFAAGDLPAWCLTLSGPYGCGKTHLAYAIANQCREDGRPYRFITAPALMAQLKNSIDEKRRSVETMAPLAYGPEEWVKVYSETTAVLVIDDYGAQQETEWATTQLFAILNARYEAHLPTVLTTNLTKAELDPRIASRCGEGFLMCVAPDQRGRFS